MNSKYKPKNKVKPFQIRWNEGLGVSKCYYAYRWCLITPWFSIRLHNFLRSDDKRYLHDHPWSFLTFVFKGQYTDVSEKGRDIMSAPCIRYRNAHHKHYVDVPKCGFWSLVITGPKTRNWGFWIKDKFKRPYKFFHKYGHPPCSEQ